MPNVELKPQNMKPIPWVNIKDEVVAKVKAMDDDTLLLQMMEWFRVGRSEGKLYGNERKYFKAICKEIGKRKLLKRELFV